RFYWVMMLPAIILLACISLYPFFWLIYMSLHSVGEMGQIEGWNDFRNYTRLINDKEFLNGWWLLIKYSAMCMVLEVIIGVFLAVVLNGSRFEKVLVTLFLMPMMMAPVIAGTV